MRNSSTGCQQAAGGPCQGRGEHATASSAGTALPQRRPLPGMQDRLLLPPRASPRSQAPRPGCGCRLAGAAARARVACYKPAEAGAGFPTVCAKARARPSATWQRCSSGQTNDPTWSPALLVPKASNQLKWRQEGVAHRPAAAANSSSPGECSTLAVSLRLAACVWQRAGGADDGRPGDAGSSKQRWQQRWRPRQQQQRQRWRRRRRRRQQHKPTLKRPWLPVTKKASGGTRCASQWWLLPISRYHASLHRARQRHGAKRRLGDSLGNAVIS